MYEVDPMSRTTGTVFLVGDLGRSDLLISRREGRCLFLMLGPWAWDLGADRRQKDLRRAGGDRPGLGRGSNLDGPDQ